MSVATKFKSVARNRKVVIFTASFASGVGGAIAGYKYAEKMLAQKYADISDREIAQAREHYTRVFKDGEWADPSVLAQKYQDVEEQLEESEEKNEEADAAIRTAAKIIDREGYTPYNRPNDISERVVNPPAQVVQNIFVTNRPNEDDDSEEVYDVEAESAKKSAGKPYIVEYEEWVDNLDDREKSVLTWYAVDEVVVDENERPLSPDQFRTTLGGPENLRFGYVSGDPNTVLIYNDKLDAAYEVIRDPGSYRDIVLGINDHVLQHEDRQSHKPRKMRRED